MSQEDTVSVTTAQVQPLVIKVSYVRYFRVNPRIDRGNDTSMEVAECTGKSSICPRGYVPRISHEVVHTVVDAKCSCIYQIFDHIEHYHPYCFLTKCVNHHPCSLQEYSELYLVSKCQKDKTLKFQKSQNIYQIHAPIQPFT